jgi:hypothetical protein
MKRTTRAIKSTRGQLKTLSAMKRVMTTLEVSDGSGFSKCPLTHETMRYAQAKTPKAMTALAAEKLP